MDRTNINKPGLPLVVHIGFAGSRNLVDRSAHPHVDLEQFELKLQAELVSILEKMPDELGLSEKHFICAISQVAIGADTVFTRSCAELGWLQRVFLPQLRDDYLAASGSDGVPDFSLEQRQTARGLLESAHIIQERVVSDSLDRTERFEDVNREISRVSDCVVCMIRNEADARPGGSLDLIERAQQRNLPLLEIRVGVNRDGSPDCTVRWHKLDQFRIPSLPTELNDLQTSLDEVPLTSDYCQALRNFVSKQAMHKRNLFARAAFSIVAAHVLATFCAVLAVKPLWNLERVVIAILTLEIVLLAIGLGVHQWLHHTKAIKAWATHRLIAEINRSVSALEGVHGYLSHLFILPIPDELRPLCRTLNVLHLRSSRESASDSWMLRRDEYVHNRLERERGGQIDYYGGKLRQARSQLRLASYAFLGASGLAIAATVGKVVIIYLGWSYGTWPTLLGMAAILLPVVAVGAMSLAASFDLEAREHTFHAMHEFAQDQARKLREAKSERDFRDLALETEARLLGENTTWYARRAYVGVT